MMASRNLSDMRDTPQAMAGDDMARDIGALGRTGIVPTLLRVVCETTGMGFAAVARISGGTLTAFAVVDDIHVGLAPGGRLDADALRSMAGHFSVPITLASGRDFGVLCACDRKPADVADPRTVSMFKRFAALIAQQLDEAAVDDRERAALLDEFLTLLGHDLRNPLQAVYASGELLERKLTDPALLTIAARVRVNARRMSALVDDVLDLARGRLGPGVEVELADVERIEASLAAVVKGLHDAKQSREITTRFQVDRTVRCDVGRVQRVASNLLTNALTHGAPDGPVEISARTDDRDLILEVWNGGPPIPPDSLQKLFQPFWRQAGGGRRQGLGLGLYLCSQIVAAHGGALSVVSTAETGTRFTVRLPLAGRAV